MPGAVVRWSQRHASWLRTIAVFTPAVLLFIPILRYSLDTPFGLIDDYADWKYGIILTSPSLYGDWIAYTFIDTESLRYRPFWEFYNATTWSISEPIRGCITWRGGYSISRQFSCSRQHSFALPERMEMEPE